MRRHSWGTLRTLLAGPARDGATLDPKFELAVTGHHVRPDVLWQDGNVVDRSDLNPLPR